MQPTKTNELLQFGILSAIAGVLSYIILYLGGTEWMTSPAAFITSLLPIVFAVLACLKVRKRKEGFLEFSEALKTSFGIFVITGMVVTLFSYVLLNYIDTDFKVAMEQASLEMSENMMKKFGASQEQIDKAMEEATKKDNFSFGNIMLGFAFSTILWFLISLIISLIVRKKNPNEGMPQSM